MKNLLLLTALLILLTTSCDDTRKIMHEKYAAFVSDNDSLFDAHAETTATHQEIKEDHLSITAQLRDLETADSIALEDVKKHKMLLQQQEILLDSLALVFSKRKSFKEDYEADALSETQFESRLQEIRKNSAAIGKNLEEIQSELTRIKEDQSRITKSVEKTE